MPVLTGRKSANVDYFQVEFGKGFLDRANLWVECQLKKASLSQMANESLGTITGVSITEDCTFLFKGPLPEIVWEQTISVKSTKARIKIECVQ